MATIQGALLSTVHTYLMVGTTSGSSTTWARLCDINSFPSPDGGLASAVYSKNLSSRTPKSAQGWYEDDSSAMDFTADYDLTTYKDLKTIEAAGAVGQYAIWIGGTETTDATTGQTTISPTGSYGKFTGYGTLSVSKDGGETDGFQTMTVRINKTAPWTESTPSN